MSTTKAKTFVGAPLLAAFIAALAVAFPTSASAATRLVATVGPGYTITLRTAAGRPVRTLKAGLYTIVVRDRSSEHNFRLSGRGVNKATSVDGVGTQTWRVRIARGAYRYVCDPHDDMMRGAFRAR
jgi:hypothetical protein